MALFRQFAAQLLLTVVSAISLLGSGLHLLPGCNHFHEECASCDEHADCDHSHADQHDGDDHKSDSNCAICRFMAIPWALSSPPTIADCGRPFELLVAVSAPKPAIEAFHPYGARAPPQSPSVV